MSEKRILQESEKCIKIKKAITNKIINNIWLKEKELATYIWGLDQSWKSYHDTVATMCDHLHACNI